MSDATGQRQHADTTRMSTGELVSAVTEQASALIRDEIRLASLELKEKGKHAGIGAGMFGGTAVLGFYAGGALVAAGIAALSLALHVWAAALIVTAVLAALAAITALTGRRQVQEALPPMPEQTKENVRIDIETVKAARS
ncbi:MAG TPA: phage holin family protein [Sporichthyaceae bacterium]|jgi:MFS family permease|nr:phage holin family protein [Sporichthyaceae bacterium]